VTALLLAGGGTTGHLTPLMATADAVKALDARAEITCVGTLKGLETSVLPAAGLTLRLIPAVPMPRRLTPDLAKLPWRLRRAIRQAEVIIHETEAAVVVGFGGYVSLPVYLAAHRVHVPIVMHEQNALPGLANRLTARFSDAVLVSFPGTPLPKARLVGLPVRPTVVALAADGRESKRAEARAALGLPAVGPVLLVSGGSQGAVRINDAVTGARDDLLAAGCSIVHVWGPRNLPADAAPLDGANGARYLPLRYVDDMASAYAAADLMLARSGAATVAETALVGLPCLFVPYPHGNGEQYRNSAAIVAAGGGEQVADASLTPARLLQIVLPLLAEPGRLSAMGRAAQATTQPGAAERVAEVALRLAKEQR